MSWSKWHVRTVLNLLILALGGSSCWLAVGVKDSPVSRDAYPFVETVTDECYTCVGQSCRDELIACVQSSSCSIWPIHPLNGAMPAEAEVLKLCLRTNCFLPCYDPYRVADDFLAPKNEQAPIAAPPPPDDCLTQNPSLGCLAGGRSAPGDNYGNVRCDPVSNVPCDTKANEACSLDMNIHPADLSTARLSCRETGHVLPPTSDCGPIEGQCAPGSDCFLGRCYRYCGQDNDCGGQGICFFILPYQDLCLGICVASLGPGPPVCMPP
jgi:hypothetical protein